MERWDHPNFIENKKKQEHHKMMLIKRLRIGGQSWGLLTVNSNQYCPSSNKYRKITIRGKAELSKNYKIRLTA